MAIIHFRNQITKELYQALSEDKKEEIEQWRKAPENVGLPAAGEDETEIDGALKGDADEAARMKHARELQE